jgi:hypothetical protein
MGFSTALYGKRLISIYSVNLLRVDSGFFGFSVDLFSFFFSNAMNMSVFFIEMQGEVFQNFSGVEQH